MKKAVEESVSPVQNGEVQTIPQQGPAPLLRDGESALRQGRSGVERVVGLRESGTVGKTRISTREFRRSSARPYRSWRAMKGMFRGIFSWRRLT